MAEDVNASIGIDIDASQAIAAIRQLSAEISAFHQLHSKRGAAVAKDLAAQTQNLTQLINRTGSYRASMTSVASATESFTTALEKNKLTMGETMRYAMGSVKPFSKMFKSEWEMVSKVARERVKDLQTQYVRLGRDANGAVQAIKIRPLTLDMDNLQTKTMLAAQRMQVLNKLVEHGSTQLLNWGKNTQWAGRQLMVGFTIPLTMLGAASAKTFMDMEKQIIKIQRVYGDFSTTVEETKNMTDSLKELSLEFTKWGVSVDKTLGLAADAAATGAMGADLINQVTNATRLAVLGNVEQAQALETTMSVTNAFGIATEDLAKKIDFLNAVENQSVTSIEDLTTAIPIAAPVIKQLGGNVEDLAFFMTAMKEGGIDAGEGANALKSGLASIINPTEKAVEMLKQYGININEIVSNNKGDVKGTVIEFAQALDTLDPLNRAQAIEQLFGKFQFSRISTLFQNVIKEGTQAQRVLELSQASTEQLAVLSQRELAKIEESTTYKFEAAMQRFQASLAPVGEEFLKAVTPLLDFGTQLLNQFNTWDQGAKTFAVTLTGVIAGIGPVLLMSIGLIANGVANLIKVFKFIGGAISGAANSTDILGMQTEYMTQDMIEAQAAAASLSQTHSNLTQVYTSEASALGKLAGALAQAAAAQRKMEATAPVIGRTPATKKYSKGTMSVPGYASGIVSVPGPKGKGDVVPAMLSPGEAVVPADMAKKYAPLIQGMVSGNIPGYAKGFTEETHLSSAMQKNKGTMSQVDAVLPGFSGLPKAIQDIMVVLSDLTSTKSRTLNQAAKESGMDSDSFLSEWRKSPDGLVASAARAADAAGEQLNQKDVKALVGIDEEIGTRVAERIKKLPDITKLKPGWLDDIIAEETTAVIDKGLKSTDVTVKKNAQRLQDRKQTVGTVRSVGMKNAIDPVTGKPYGSETAFIEAQRKAGNLEPRAGKVGLYGKGTDIQVTRTAYSGDPAIRKEQQKLALQERQQGLPTSFPQRSNSQTKGTFKGSYEAPTAGAKAQAKRAGVLVVRTQSEALAEGMATEAQTASPSKRTRKVAKDTVDGYVDGLEEGKAKVAKQSRTLMSDIVKNTNPAFGMVAAGAPQQVNPNTMRFFEQKTMPKVMTASQMQNTKLQVDMFQQRVNMMARSIEQARTPIIMLQDTATMVNGRLAEVARASKDFATKTADAAKKLAISAKEAAVSVTNSAKQMAVNAGGAIGGRARKLGAKAKNFVTSGRGAMIGGTASMGLMMASGMGGPVGDVAGAISGPMMALSMLGPLLGSLPAPVTAVIVALGALAAVGIGAKIAFDNAQRAAEEFANATGASTDAMNALAEASGNVSATQEMNMRRENAMKFARTEETNAASQQYLSSEAGKASIQSLGTAMSSGAAGAAINNIVSQMSTAIASGAISRVDARAIVEDIGTELGDRTFALKANAKIDQLLGPNGENLSKDPINVRLNILKDTEKQVSQLGKEVDGLGKDLMTEMLPNMIGNMTDFSSVESSMKSIGMMVANIATPIPLIVEGITQVQELGTQTAAFAANMTIANQQSQQMLDSLQLEYEQRIANANAAGDVKEAERLTLEYQKGRTKLLEQSAKLNKDAADAYSKMEFNAKTGVIGSLDQQIKDLYSEGPMKAIGEQAISQIGNLAGGTTAEFTLKAAVAGGEIDPGTMTSILGILGKDQVDVAANIITSFGGASADQVFEFASMITDPEKAKDFTLTVEGMTPEEMTSTMSLLETVGKTGGQAALDVMLNMDPAKLEDTVERLSDFDKLAAEGPITIERLMTLDTFVDYEGMKAIESQQDYFSQLPLVQQRYFVTVAASITDEDVQAWARKNRGVVMARDLGKQEIIGIIAREMTSQAISSGGFTTPPSTGPEDTNVDTGGGGGGAEPKTEQEIQLENLNNQLSKQQKALNILSFQEDEINKKYEKRKEALQEIADINSQIAEEQKQQLSLANALASGDIAAAAQAAQEMRASAAEKAIKDQEKALEAAQKRELATVTFEGKTREQWESQIKALEKQIAELEYRMPQKAKGGLVTGPGNSTSDSIPTMLSNGEYVVRASSVAKIGLSALEAINAGKIPELTGGRVSIDNINLNGRGPAFNKQQSQMEASSSVYNYSVVVNAQTNSNPDQIASAVMAKIKQVEGQRVRGVIR
jgi:TP901 family phage tail tape measure protein